MKIYNTLTRGKEEFIPIKKDTVKMYVCGPTVYDVPHIGHFRSAYVFDFIRKYLEYSGYKVIFVRNITDIDDKIIQRARDEAKGDSTGAPRDIKKTAKKIAEHYLKIYDETMLSLGIMKPSKEPKATDNIKEMIDFISSLINKGYAYVSGADVYFSVDKFDKYGKLSGQNIEEMIERERANGEKIKKHKLDFALWKGAKEDEPSWPSPWGDGRPGWHIECSTMSTNTLGKEFDIHGGGLDLIFPHHENEIAQSESLNSGVFARVWVHNGLLTINKDKMSKSLKNFITLESFLAEYKDPDIIKILFLSSHYRSPVDYSSEKLEEAKRIKERIVNFVGHAGKRLSKSSVKISGKNNKTAGNNQDAEIRFKTAMDDDFNTPEVLAGLFESIHKGNEYLAGSKISEEGNIFLKKTENFIKRFSGIFSLSFKEESLMDSMSSKVSLLVEKREKARKGKNFDQADKIRQELDLMGIVVEDTTEGTIWRKR